MIHQVGRHMHNPSSTDVLPHRVVVCVVVHTTPHNQWCAAATLVLCLAAEKGYVGAQIDPGEVGAVCKLYWVLAACAHSLCRSGRVLTASAVGSAPLR